MLALIIKGSKERTKWLKFSVNGRHFQVPENKYSSSESKINV